MMLPTVTVAAGTTPVTEGRDATFTVTRTVVTTGALTVRYDVSENGAMVASGEEGAKTIDFSGDEESVTITVPTVGDSAHEDDSVVTVTLTADDAYDIGTATATVTVEDDDDAAPLSLPSPGATFVAERQASLILPEATGGTPPYTYAVTHSGGAPRYGLAFAPATRTLSGNIPDAAVPVSEGGWGEFGTPDDPDGVVFFTTSLVYSVTDADGATVTSDMEVNLVDFPDGFFPTPDNVSVVEDTAMTPVVLTQTPWTTRFTYALTGPNGTDLSQVPGLSFAPSTRTLSGTPTEAGTTTLTYTATHTNFKPTVTFTATFDITVTGDAETLPTVTVTPNASSYTEGLHVTFTISRTGPTTSPLIVHFSLSETGDTLGVTGDQSTTIDAGQSSKSVAYSTNDDSVEELNSTVTLMLQADTAYTIGTPNSASITVEDNDTLPTVTVTPQTTPVTEGTNAVFTIARTGATTAPLRVLLSVSETGDVLQSGQTGDRSISISGGRSSQNFVVRTTDDNAHEADGSVTLTLTANEAYTVGTPSSAEIAIEDNDNVAPTGVPTISDTTPTVGDTLTARTSGIGDPDGLTTPSFTYQWIRTSGGTDTPITGETSSTYTVVAADVGNTLKVTVGFTDDDGTNETLTSAATATVPAPPKPSVSVAAGTTPVTEGTAATFTVTRTVFTTGALTVNYSVSENGTMVAAANEGAKSVSFAGNATTATITVATQGDSGHEADSVVTVTLTADDAYDIGTATAMVTVEDDDNANPTGVPTISDTTPTVGDTLTAVTSGIGDPDGLTTPSFTYQWIRTSGATDTPITGETSSTYTVVAADVGNTLKVRVGFTDDDDTAETLTSAETSTVVTAPTTPMTPSLVSNTGQTTDGDALIQAGYAQRIRTGTAASGYDIDSVVLDFDQAATSGTTTVTIRNTSSGNPAGTALATLTTPTSTVGLNVFAVSGSLRLETDTVYWIVAEHSDSNGPRWRRTQPNAGVDSGAAAGWTIVRRYKTSNGNSWSDGPDNAFKLQVKGSAVPQISIGDESVAEGDAGDRTALEFTVELDKASPQAVTVDWETRDNQTADYVTDFIEADGSLTFDPGETEQTLTVTVVGDDVDEPNETFRVVLSNLSSNAAVGDGGATGTIVDDDNVAPSGEPTIDDTTPVVGDVLTADTSGITDTDGLTGATFAYRWIRVAADSTETPVGTDATYTVVDADVGATLKVVVTYTDDGGAAETVESAQTSVTASSEPSVSVAAVASPVTEGADAQFTVTRTGVTTGALTVHYGVSENGAMVAATEEGAKTIDFSGDEESVTITVPTEGDSAHEDDSVVTVTLTADDAYDIGTAMATVTVEDDDNADPTGVPTIDDTTPVVGEMLTAITTAIGDPDGLTSPTFTYQWVRVSGGSGTDIPSANSQTYTVVAADVGATLKVEVGFADDDGANETVESVQTATVVAASALPSLVGNTGRTTDGDERIQAGYAQRIRTGTAADGYDIDSLILDFAQAATSGTTTVTIRNTSRGNPADAVLATLTAPASTVGLNEFAVSGSLHLEPDTVYWIVAEHSDSNGPRWRRTQPNAGVDSGSAAGWDIVRRYKTRNGNSWSDGPDNAFKLQVKGSEADPLPSVSVAQVSSPVAEGAGAQFTVTRTGVTTGALTVSYDVSESDAMVASGEEGAKTIDFSGNEESVTITVPTEGDSAHEADSTVTVTLTADDAYSIGTAAATVTVEDDDNADPTGVPTISDTTPAVGDTLTALTSGIGDPDGLTSPTFTYQWVRVSGGNETDISSATSQTYTVVDADVGATLKVEVGFADDDGFNETLESAETSAVTAASQPSVSVARVSSPVTEGANAQFTVTRTGVTTGALTVSYDVSENGAMVASDEEGAKTIDFSGDEESVTITVPTEGDNAHEDDSVVTVTLTADDAYDIGTATATVTVEDDDNADPTGRPTISDTTPTVGDTLTAVTSGIGDPDGLTSPTFTYRWVRVSGGNETDLGTAASYTVVAADVGATLKVEVGFTDDDDTAETVESTETSAVTAASKPSVSVAAVASPVAEGANAQFTVTRTGVTTGALTVSYDVSESGAMVASDEEGAKTIDFSGNEESVTITVPTLGDSAHEADSVVTVTLTANPAYEVGTATAEVTVEDDDAPTVSIGAPAAAVTEGGTLSFPVALNRAGYLEVTLDYAVTGGTAEAGDTTDAGGGTLTIPAGDTSAHIELDVVDDTVDEPDSETVEVTISNLRPAGAATIGDATATGTITDNDDAPTVTLNLTPDAIAENGGESTVTARLDHPSSAETTVTVSAAPVAPAVAGDFTLSSNLELTIAAGQTQSTGLVTITAVDNDVEAPDRTVTVSGTAANDQGFAGPQDVTLTLADDDGRKLTIADAGVTEDGSGNTTMRFTVTLAPAATAEVTVDWETADGTAEAGTDYTAGSGSLTFGPGETDKTVSVPVTDDDVDEPDETFTVTLSNESGASLEKATGTGTITDNDATPTVTLVLTPDTIVENSGVSTVTARLDRPSSAETTVTVSAAPVAPAVAGDFTLSASRVLTVAAGQTTSTGLVTMTAVDNDVEAPDRRVTVSGTATNDQGVTAPGDVTLRIADDEGADKRRRRLEYALASFGRTVAQDLVAVLEDREWSARAGTTATLAGTPLTPDSSRLEEALYGALRRHTGPDGDLAGEAALRELLYRSRFRLSLGNEDAGEGGGSGAGSVVLWGRGSRSWSEGRLDPAVATRGEVFSGQLGLEYRLREDTSLGVMLNGSGGELDFDEALETEVEADLVSVHPYARWSPRQGLSAWAMVGYGMGEATLTDSFTTRTGTDVETDIEMVMAAAGGRNELASRWGIDWSLGTNGFFVQLDAEERGRLLPAVRSEVWQARLLLEGRAGKELDGGSELSGNVELAARVDGGDAETGMGMELGGGVAYGHPALGIDVEASGRVLLSHEDGLEDAGVSLALGADPGERGRGVYFALTPSWGNTASGARAMWEDRQASTGGLHGPDGRRFDPTMRLDSELGYTTPLPTRRGALTSYVAFSSDGGAARQYRIGRRLELADILSVSFEAERRESAWAVPEHGIRLKSNLRF